VAPTIIDTSRIEDYLTLKSHYDDSSKLVGGANKIRVLGLKNVSGGVTNNLYSFALKFSRQGIEHQLALILKIYPEATSLWFKTYRPNEDVRKYVREFEAMRSLERFNFPVPHVYLCECDSFFLGYPFVIMQQEKIMQESEDNLARFAATLARLHNLKANELGIRSMAFPKDDSAFAKEWPFRFKHVLAETRHYRSLKKDFEFAIRWLEENSANNRCPQYCLVHGEYHPGHTIVTDDNVLKVIDWEGAAIGDPTFDVGYAYHVVKLMSECKKSGSGEEDAERLISEYAKNFDGDINPRLEYYKVVGILGVTIAVSSMMSNPIVAYKRFGHKALARSLAFPFLRFHLVDRKWMNADFLVSYLQYFQDFVNTTLKR
jgi:aminoglycoside phosphotransferase (APT) family kinase protein